MATNKKVTLKKTLTPLQLWALAVGLVISGEYFGWNLGWQAGGTMGFLIATIIATIMYVCFIFSFTELTTSIPHAGGPFAYAAKALGPAGGLIAGYATLIEFLFGPPAIAFALGAYIHFLYPGVPVLFTATAIYFIFTGINLLGIRESAIFNLIITIVAIAELILFMGITLPHFKATNFLADNLPHGYAGIFAALPFAIWFYLGIEGVAMVAEEVKPPVSNISKGYITGIVTLVVLALGVMFAAGGVGDWKALSTIDYPLPQSISMVMGTSNGWTKIFAGIGLFGLIASFHGLIIGYSRQLFALSRSGLLPAKLSEVNARFQTPHWALIAGGVVGIISVYSGTTDKVIILSALGAVVMYGISMISLLQLRKKQPLYLVSSTVYRTPFYPYFPWIALILSLVCLVAIIWYNLLLSSIFFAGLIVVMGWFYLSGQVKNIVIDEPANNL